MNVKKKIFRLIINLINVILKFYTYNVLEFITNYYIIYKYIIFFKKSLEFINYFLLKIISIIT